MSMLREFRGNKSDLSKIKLSVCVPCRDMLHSAFAFDLCKLQEYNALMGIKTVVHFHIGTLLVNQREQLVQMAKDAGSTHILWLDSDMMFPPNTAHALLKHGESIVAANYVTRQYPHKTVAYTSTDGWDDYLINSKNTTDSLIPVVAIGMGCMLTSLDVYNRMSVPYFQTTWNPTTNDHVGEDFTFCYNAAKLGYRILVDNDLSLNIQHLGTFAFTHSMALPHKQ